MRHSSKRGGIKAICGSCAAGRRGAGVGEEVRDEKGRVEGRKARWIPTLRQSGEIDFQRCLLLQGGVKSQRLKKKQKKAGGRKERKRSRGEHEPI